MFKRLYVGLQYLLPQLALSRWIGQIADSRQPWLKNWCIKRFIAAYRVNMQDALIENPTDYVCFNDFFIRQLKADARPIANGAADIACPVDGTIAQIGPIEKNQLLQVKGCYFDLETLLSGDLDLAKQFHDGFFTTLYLAPDNYHRVHMPLTGKLKKYLYVPGKLFSVNQTTSQLIPQLYSQNERLICSFETAAGPMVVILVGAMIVGSIQTVWMKEPIRSLQPHAITPADPIQINKGDELGYFKLGSTVLVLYGKNAIAWEAALAANNVVQVGQKVGTINNIL